MNTQIFNEIQKKVNLWEEKNIRSIISRYKHICTSLSHLDFNVQRFEMVSIRNWTYKIYLKDKLISSLTIDSDTGEVLNEKNGGDK